jgi:hypothetical protein
MTTRPSKIYIMALDFVHAQNLATAAHLAPTDWLWLYSPEQLVGVQAPDVVHLPAAASRRLYEPIMAQLNARSATIWSELDLIKGRIR